MLFVVLCPGTPEGSTSSGSGFKASQKTGQRLKVSSDRLGKSLRCADCWLGPNTLQHIFETCTVHNAERRTSKHYTQYYSKFKPTSNWK